MTVTKTHNTVYQDAHMTVKKNVQEKMNSTAHHCPTIQWQKRQKQRKTRSSKPSQYAVAKCPQKQMENTTH